MEDTEIEAMMSRLRAASDRSTMALEALCEVIESTQHFREGYYSLRKVLDYKSKIAGMANSMNNEEQFEQVLGAMEEFTGHVLAEVERVERLAKPQ